MNVRGIGFREAVTFLTGREARPAPSRRRLAAQPNADRTTTTAALALWRQGVDPRRTIAKQYMASRRLDLGEDLAGDVLRWHLGTGALLALFRDIATDEPRAIARTFVDAEGRKLGRKFLGPVAGCAVKLDPDDEVLEGLHVGEGVETGMAARQLGLRPCWALGSAHAVAAFRVLAGVECLTLLAERRGQRPRRRGVRRALVRGRPRGADQRTPRRQGSERRNSEEPMTGIDAVSTTRTYEPPDDNGVAEARRSNGGCSGAPVEQRVSPREREAAHSPRAPEAGPPVERGKGADPNHEPQAADAKTVAELPVVSAASFAGKPAPPRPWHVPEWIPGRQVTLFGGDGGVGKSLIAMQLSVATVTGLQWFEMTPRHGPVVYVSAEEDIDELQRRVEDIAATYGVPLADLADLHLISLAGQDAVMATPSKPGVIVPTAVWRGLGARVAQFKPVLIVIDTAADTYAGDENKRPEVRQFIGQLRGMSIHHDLATLLLNHPSQTGLTSGSGTSGSTAWSNSVRARLYLDRIKDDDGKEVAADFRVLTVKKSNYGPPDAELRLRWSAGCFVHDGPMAAGGLDKLAAEAKAERVFCDLLAALIGQGRDVSPKPSPSYAPAVFANHPSAAGIAKKGFAAAMERLFEAGRIRVEDTDGPKSKRFKRIVFTPLKADHEGLRTPC